MNRLEDYYDTRVASLGEREFLKQVGHTENGVAITQGQFRIMVEQLRDLLEPDREDILLDLCCGNGLITADLGGDVSQSVGVDLSGKLSETAQRHHSASHIQYYQGDVLALAEIAELGRLKFNKILMHGALQHFTAQQFAPLLSAILSVSSQSPTIVFGFVPENGKQDLFFNTPKRRLEGLSRRLAGQDIFGTWWDRSFIKETCGKYGLSCSFHSIDKSQKASAYRMNVRVTRDQISKRAR